MNPSAYYDTAINYVRNRRGEIIGTAPGVSILMKLAQNADETTRLVYNTLREFRESEHPLRYFDTRMQAAMEQTQNT